MNVEKLLKIVGIGGLCYGALNATFQYGKGCMLRNMKKNDLTVDDMYSIIKTNKHTLPLSKQINWMFIDAGSFELSNSKVES